MFTVEDNNIFITRGNSAFLPFDVMDKDGNSYVVQPDDAVIMTVKKTAEDTQYLIQKQLVNGMFSIVPTDTAGLDFGDYVYDVWITMVNGYTDQIIPVSLFRILKEVK